MFNIKKGLSFDDVLLEPQYSKVKSRSTVDISVKWNDFKFNHPIIPANMQTVTGMEMAYEIIGSGGLAILHRFMPIEEQFEIAEDIVEELNGANNFAVSVGVKFEDQNNIKRFNEIGVKIICIDIAHGDSVQCIDMIEWVKNNYPNMFIIAGNVATGEGAQRLWLAGADAVKVGIGPGSLCTTRIETGNGVPQLTALMDVAEKRAQLTTTKYVYYYFDNRKTINRPIYIIADGGIKSAGDIVKALCFADMVMVGNIFAGCTATPGNIINIDGKQYKEYVGSSTHKTNHIEGVAALVSVKGSYESILNKLTEGLRSGCSYQGVTNLKELQDNPVFIEMSSAGLRESHPHDVILK